MKDIITSYKKYRLTHKEENRILFYNCIPESFIFENNCFINVTYGLQYSRSLFCITLNLKINTKGEEI